MTAYTEGYDAGYALRGTVDDNPYFVLGEITDGSRWAVGYRLGADHRAQDDERADPHWPADYESNAA